MSGFRDAEQPHGGDKVADVQRRGGRVESAVRDDRSMREMPSEAVGVLVQHCARAQDVEKRGSGAHRARI